MSFAKSFLPALTLAIAGCGGIADDLVPSGSDRRVPVEADGEGPSVGRRAPGFSARNSLNETVALSAELSRPGTKAVVLYFAMWCPICNGHLDHLLREILPRFPDAKAFAVDYVSGSAEDARSNAISNGFAASRISVLADSDNSILDAYDATMGTTVVIDRTGTVRMNEDYKDGTKLRRILEALP